MNKSIGVLLKKSSGGKRYKIIFAGILAITVGHFVMQMSFIQSENSRSAELTAQIEDLKPMVEEPEVETTQSDKRIIEIEPEEFEVRKVKIITLPENIKPPVRRQAESAASSLPKKKVVRETKAERLRRAERILTGV